MAKLVVDKESLVSVADAIRAKGGAIESLEFPQGFVDAVGAIESGDGDTEEIENIIDASGVLDSTDGTVEDKVEQLTELLNFFKNDCRGISMMGNRTTKETPIIDCKKYTSMNSAFHSTYTDNVNPIGLETVRLKNTQNVNDWSGIFYNARALKTAEIFDLSGATKISQMFDNCYSLVTIKFVPRTIKRTISLAFSSKLSDESIQSIIDGLATVETAQKLTLHTSVVANLTETQVEQIYLKKWEVG